MIRLYRRNELVFSLLWIVSYVVLLSMAETISDRIGVAKAVTFPVSLAFVIGIITFVRKNNLSEYYGIGRSRGMKYRRFLYFIPFAVLVSSNLWNGVTVRYTAFETVFYTAGMLCVGFVEELIFRGFLFQAIAKKSLKTAIVISSITFGLGHLVNLLNGAEVLPTILQMIYATAIGYLFTVFLIKSKNLIPCIVTHGVINALSAFAVEGSAANQILCTAVLTVISLGYAVYLNGNARIGKSD